MKYWLVKGTRDKTDWSKILSPGEISRWSSVTRLPIEMRRGDRVFYWMTYPDLCVIALGSVVEMKPPDARGTSYFWVESLTQAFSDPITMAALREESIFAGAAFLRRGQHKTEYPLTEEQAHRIYEMAAQHNVLPTYIAGWFRSSNSRPFEALLGGADGAEPFDPTSIDDGRQRVFRTIVQRQGQGAFREQLLEAYGGRCALTDCEEPRVLEAAHIVPYRGPKTNHVTNGLLLRADLHVLFDLGLLRVDPESLTVEIDSSVRGTLYTELSGRELRLPASIKQRPSVEALAWHAEQSRSASRSTTRRNRNRP